MQTKDLNIGFIGGGRISHIMLKVFSQHKLSFRNLSVYDPSSAKAKELSLLYPEIQFLTSASTLVKDSDIVVLAVHPHVFPEVLQEIREELTPEKMLISLSPKWTIAKIQDVSGHRGAVARVIPNAPSVIGEGYNAFAVSDNISDIQREMLHTLFHPMGVLLPVAESKLEAYATFTGMGPTYLWFLFREMYEQALQCGLSDQEARQALNAMIKGASETLFQSDLNYEQVLDLIPAYPMKPKEDEVKKTYAEVIAALYQKLSS